MYLLYALTMAIAIIFGASGLSATEEPHIIAKLMQIDEPNHRVTVYRGDWNIIGMKSGNTILQINDDNMLKGLALGDTVQLQIAILAGTPTITFIEKYEGEYDDHAH